MLERSCLDTHHTVNTPEMRPPLDLGHFLKSPNIYTNEVIPLIRTLLLTSKVIGVHCSPIALFMWTSGKMDRTNGEIVWTHVTPKVTR